MIRDETTGERLASRARPVRGLLRQAFGLMLRPKLEDEGWVFLFARKGRWDLTNLFVFQTIDCLWIDRKMQVLQKRTVRPFVPNVAGHDGTRYVLELPAGAAENVSVGDRVSWTFSG